MEINVYKFLAAVYFDSHGRRKSSVDREKHREIIMVILVSSVYTICDSDLSIGFTYKSIVIEEL